MSLTSHSNATSALLTDEAVRAIDEASGEHVIGAESLVRYHATEGRDAAVETVKAVFDERFPYISRDLPVNTISEAIVDAVFGRPE